MTIKYEIYSDREEDKDLVKRYWAKDAEGGFKERVKDLLPFGEIKTSRQLLLYINEISKAWDERFKCARCAIHLVKNSRSDNFSLSKQVCGDCRQKEQEQYEQERQNELNELNKRLDEITENSNNLKLNYMDLTDDMVLLLIALERAINPRIMSNTFTVSQCSGLAPGHIGDFVRKLYKSGVITHYPPHALTNAYVLEDESIIFYLERVAWMLGADVNFERGSETFDILRMRELTQYSSILQLWLDYAVSDCMAYLYSQCSLHNLSTDSEDDEKIISILRTSLETYSIAQLWSTIWKVVRDAASLSTRDYYSLSKAAATLPGKIKRYLEKQQKEGKSLRYWERPNYQPAGTLGDVFYEYFGIDEKSSGAEVVEMFSEKEGDAEGGEELEEVTKQIVRRVQSLGLETKFLITFAEHIRHGKSVREALLELIDECPALGEG